jgi:ABC-2 type transport system permease protein
LMFTYLFGGAIAGSTAEYLQFLLPGILAMNIVMITVYTGVDLNSDVAKGVFDRFRTLPIWTPAVLVGALLVDLVRYTIVTLIMLVLGFALGFRPEGSLFGIAGATALLLVFSFSVSWIWTMLGLIMRSEKSLMAASWTVLFPLTFVSNVFVDPETLPPLLRGFVEVNPVSLLVTAVRGLIHGSASLEQIGWALLSSVIITAIFAPLAMRLYLNKQ